MLINKHMDFFKERAREFLIENFLNGSNNHGGRRIKNEFYPTLRLRSGLEGVRRREKSLSFGGTGSLESHARPKSIQRARMITTNDYMEYSVMTDTSPSVLKQRLLTYKPQTPFKVDARGKSTVK
jgi:hypothetical protein